MFRYLLLISSVLFVKAHPLSESEAIKSNHLFGVNFYKELKDSDGNIIFSPYSIKTILSLTYAGAQSKTADELAAVLHLPDQTTTAKLYKKHTDKLKTSSDLVKLTSANKIYAASGSPIKDSFKEIAVNSFDADVETLSFANPPETAEIINKWVSNHTNNKINNLLTPQNVPPSTEVVLVNAIHFFGKWLIEMKTANLKFQVKKDTYIPVAAMKSKGTYNWKDLKDLDAELVQIPYQDTDYSFNIILPKTFEGLENVENKLQSHLSELFTDWNNEVVKLTMPKFKIEQGLDLVANLRKLGLNSPFDSSANFSGISDNKLVISNVIHKAYLDVQEKGTEGAAATAVIFLRTSAWNPQRQEPKAITVDKPFLFAIVQHSSNSILFMGRIKQLEAYQKPAEI